MKIDKVQKAAGLERLRREISRDLPMTHQPYDEVGGLQCGV